MSALGAEAEASFEITSRWSVWTNLIIRRRWIDVKEDTWEEGQLSRYLPAFRFNLGMRFLSDEGPTADLALHYRSAYAPKLDYQEYTLGDTWLLFGRLGYRLPLGPAATAETGLTLRLPLNGARREVPGRASDPWEHHFDGSDRGGELVVRLISAYLRVCY
jgi:hypothetical protein